MKRNPKQQQLNNYISYNNKKVSENITHTQSAVLHLESIRGIKNDNANGQPILTLNTEEIMCYTCKYYLVENLQTKESIVIDREGSRNNTVLLIKKVKVDSSRNIVISIEKSENNLYIGLLHFKDFLTYPQKHKSYTWSLQKLTGLSGVTQAIDLAYSSKKNFVYILVKKGSTDHLCIYDLKKPSVFLIQEIKTNITNYSLDFVQIHPASPTELFLLGRNYVRSWNINYNEKHLKETNFRNIERCLKQKNIIGNFFIQEHLWVIITESIIYFTKNNEVTAQLRPDTTGKNKNQQNKENIDQELENSINQIYRLKLLFDEQDEGKALIQSTKKLLPQQILYTCNSKIWKTSDGSYHFFVGTNQGSVLMYQIIDMTSIKLQTEYTHKNKKPINKIAVSNKGKIIILSCENEVCTINQGILSNDEEFLEIQSLWGNANAHTTPIKSIDSPKLHHTFASMGEDKTIKVWNLRGKEKSIIFEEEFRGAALDVAFHPNGFMLAVNQETQIKLFTILPDSFFELTNVKPNYNCRRIAYSPYGDYLVANEEAVLVIYDPLTLKVIKYIEPSDLKYCIVDFQISSKGTHITFVCSDNSVFIKEIDFANEGEVCQMEMAHRQVEPYTCFYFEPEIALDAKLSPQSKTDGIENPTTSLFIGFGKDKYMVVYDNYGKNLLFEFGVEDCLVKSVAVKDNLLFAATNKGMIRIYFWPILETFCEMEVAEINPRKIKYKPPMFQEYSVWSENIAVESIHHLNFDSKLIATDCYGNIAIFSYDRIKNNKIINEEKNMERKKMVNFMNETFYINQHQCEKRNKLITKAQNDILKVQNELMKQKICLQNKQIEEEDEFHRLITKKTEIQLDQKNSYFIREEAAIEVLEDQLQSMQKNAAQVKQQLQQTYASKKQYQKVRKEKLQQTMKNCFIEHKQRIKDKIHSYKQQIRITRQDYIQRVKKTQKDFEEFVSVKKIEPSQDINLDDAMDISRKEDTEQQILILEIKVEQQKESKKNLERELQEYEEKVNLMEYEDQQLQNRFEQELEDYNSMRFNNLMLHSQVLKMQNQLIERKEILQNKEEISEMGYQEKNKLQNYTELVKGSLRILQGKKADIYDSVQQKQKDLNHIFRELIGEIEAMEKKKLRINELDSHIKLKTEEHKQRTTNIAKAIDRLRQMKRFLLLERLDGDDEKRRVYLEQENLLATINFLRKKLYMEGVKEKKNRFLKKSSLNQVLKQNKNLLQECNQLRAEGIEYTNEIKNLSSKLQQANKMLSIQTKLQNQNCNISEQKHQLQLIRTLFSNHLKEYQNYLPEQESLVL